MVEADPANQNPVIRLGTRGSQLALWQSNWVKSQLESRGYSVELIKIKTQGDVQTAPLAQIGGQGLFTKQLQVALLNNEIDLAVHSLKDLPTEDHPELIIAAIPERETTADALVSVQFESLSTLPEKAKVGTGSVRRAAQLLHLRPDLNIQDIRGNVDTRLKKLTNENFAAIILASAGLTRLGLADRITSEFVPDQLMPAVGQGALGLETRSTDESTRAVIGPLNHSESFQRAIAERALLRTLFAGCLAPVGANTKVEAGQLTLESVVLSQDGQGRIYACGSQPLADDVSDLEAVRMTASQLGKQVAERLLEQGAQRLLETPNRET